MQKEGRTLTDEDIEAVADALEDRIVNRFYKNLGRGVFGLAWKGLVTAAIALSAYGAVQGWWHK